MDGVVMGGGMGISQGASHRLVTPSTKMAMPETNIGLFPDVGAGYFLRRCSGHTGEWLALTGTVMDATQALALGLADLLLERDQLQATWDGLAHLPRAGKREIDGCLSGFATGSHATPALPLQEIDQFFALQSVNDIVTALESDGSEWAQTTAGLLRQRSPLMLHVALEQIRRARTMDLADDLRMERDLMRHCFAPRHLGRLGSASEAVEGIRALVIDKDQPPRWQPPRIEDIQHHMVAPFFDSPWPTAAHPLAGLA
jgi:enoyl-CoA hydratase/carnithine racemase